MLGLAFGLDFDNNGGDGDSSDDDCPLDADESNNNSTGESTLDRFRSTGGTLGLDR